MPSGICPSSYSPCGSNPESPSSGSIQEPTDVQPSDENGIGTNSCNCEGNGEPTAPTYLCESSSPSPPSSPLPTQALSSSHQWPSNEPSETPDISASSCSSGDQSSAEEQVPPSTSIPDDRGNWGSTTSNSRGQPSTSLASEDCSTTSTNVDKDNSASQPPVLPTTEDNGGNDMPDSTSDAQMPSSYSDGLEGTRTGAGDQPTGLPPAYSSGCDSNYSGNDCITVPTDTLPVEQTSAPTPSVPTESDSTASLTTNTYHLPSEPSTSTGSIGDVCHSYSSSDQRHETEIDSSALLIPIPTATASAETKAYTDTGATRSTTVTFYKATPPSSVVLVPPTTNPPGEGNPANAFSITNTISVQPTSPVHVTIIAPDEGRGMRTTVLTISEKDPSWQSIVPELIPGSSTHPTNAIAARHALSIRQVEDDMYMEDTQMDHTTFVWSYDESSNTEDIEDSEAISRGRSSSISMAVCCA